MFRKTVAILLFLTLALPLIAQTAEKSGAPNLIQIYREDVKPGKAAAHAKLESGWPAASRKAHATSYYLAATTMTGPTEAWFITPYDSLEAMEKADQFSHANPSYQAELDRLSAADGEYINSSRSIVAAFVPALSYRPQVKIGEYRYFMLDTVRVKLGHGKEFGDLRKGINAAHEKAGLDEHMLVYAVISGAPAGTYLIFQPAKSLAESDAAVKTHGEGSAYAAAIGDEGRKQARDFALNDELLFQRDWMAFSPAMSFVSPETIAAAPAYWSPKAVVAKVPAKMPKAAEGK